MALHLGQMVQVVSAVDERGLHQLRSPAYAYEGMAGVVVSETSIGGKVFVTLPCGCEHPITIRLRDYEVEPL